MNCPKCGSEMFYVASLILGKQTWKNRDEFDECDKCNFRLKRKKQKNSAGTKSADLQEGK